jgi:hypothetical protein
MIGGGIVLAVPDVLLVALGTQFFRTLAPSI